MKCPVCNSEVKELYNLNTETDEFKCFGCHLRDLDHRVRRLERQENKNEYNKFYHCCFNGFT